MYFTDISHHFEHKLVHFEFASKDYFKANIQRFWAHVHTINIWFPQILETGKVVQLKENVFKYRQSESKWPTNLSNITKKYLFLDLY